MLNSEEMQDSERGFTLESVQTALFFESHEEIYSRVFRELKPRSAPPGVHIEYCRFANADSFIRLENACLHLRLSDLFEGAPSPVVEALAYILLSKLFRRPAPRIYAHRYKLYLNRKDVRRQIHLLRQIRGRKFVSGPAGGHHNLDEIFERLNLEYFDGLLGRPALGWSRSASRSMLGHFDPAHNAIIVSRVFDTPEAPALALEFVMFHEMLHLRYPVDHAGVRRRVHTREFREAEKKYPRYMEAKEALKRL